MSTQSRTPRTPPARRSATYCAALLLASAAARAGGPAPRVHLKETPVAKHALPRLEGTLEIEVSPEHLWPLVSDCSRFKEYMDLETARVVARRGNWSRCELVVDVPFPFGKLESISDNFVERRPGVYRATWKLVSGDYVYDEGSWELTAMGSGHTLARVSMLTEPRLPVPNGMLLSGQRDYVKDMLVRLRQRALASR
jgi:hypothetical protein